MGETEFLLRWTKGGFKGMAQPPVTPLMLQTGIPLKALSCFIPIKFQEVQPRNSWDPSMSLETSSRCTEQFNHLITQGLCWCCSIYVHKSIPEYCKMHARANPITGQIPGMRIWHFSASHWETAAPWKKQSNKGNLSRCESAPPLVFLLLGSENHWRTSPGFHGW